MISALNATLNGLQEAVDAVTELKIVNITNLEDHPTYRTALARIKACHKAFGVRFP